MRPLTCTLLFAVMIGAGLTACQSPGNAQSAQSEGGGGLFLATRDSKFGFIDRSGRWVIEPTWEFVGRFSEGRAIAFSGESFSIIDESGSVVAELPEDYHEVGDFSHGLASVVRDEMVGYIGLDGDVAIDFQFERFPSEIGAGTFSDGRAVVFKDDAFGAIDTSGRLVIPFTYQYIWEFSDGVSLAIPIGRDDFNVIDTEGRVLFGERDTIKIVGSFENGFAPAYTVDYEKAGFVDKRGEWAIEPVYEWVGSFNGLYAGVVQDGKIGFIDKSGDWVIEPRFVFNEVSDDVWDYLWQNDELSRWLWIRDEIEMGFTGAFTSEESLCWVPVDERHFGFIDRSGNVVIEGEFVYARDFENGLALVFTRDRVGYIDTKGEWVYSIEINR